MPGEPDIDDILTNISFLSPKTGKIVCVNTKTKKTGEMTDNECAKKFKQHKRCGGWLVSTLDPKTFFVSIRCTKCGYTEKRTP